MVDGFQFLDPNRVILQLIVVSAELLRAAHVFLTTVLGFLQNRVELGNDFIDFPLHPIDSSVLGREASIQSLVLGCKVCVNGLKNHRSLIGEEFARYLWGGASWTWTRGERNRNGYLLQYRRRGNAVKGGLGMSPHISSKRNAPRITPTETRK